MDCYREDAQEVIDCLNTLANRNFRHTEANMKLIIGRLKEGYTVDEIRLVTAQIIKRWLSDDKMREYLRPKTLYNATNFNNYAGQYITKKEKKQKINRCKECGKKLNKNNNCEFCTSKKATVKQNYFCIYCGRKLNKAPPIKCCFCNNDILTFGQVSMTAFTPNEISMRILGKSEKS